MRFVGRKKHEAILDFQHLPMVKERYFFTNSPFSL